MATAWLFTLPCSGLVGAFAYWIANAIGGTAGVIVVLAMLVGIAIAIYLRSRKTAVRHNNVNAEWTGTVAPPVEEQVPVAA